MAASNCQVTDARGLAGVGVVLIGGFDYSYPREKSIRDGFERAGATVHECRYSDSTMFLGLRKLIIFPYIYWVLAREMAGILDQGDEPDILVVTKFDLLLLPLAAFYAWRFETRLVYDLFVSLHRTADMRGVLWPFVKATYVLERLAYRLPDNHLVGTNQFIELYSEMYGIPTERFVRIPPGADEDRFYPRDVDKRDLFTALYWGNFLPHHGVDVILDAAKELRDESIEFVFLGSGPEQNWAQNRADAADLSNVSFEGFVSDEALHHWIASSHVCLGVFSSDRRALASLTNKVCESVASGKATVTERSPAIEEWFTHGEDIYMVPPEDSETLAEAILRLQADPSLIEELEAGAVSVHEREFSADRIADLLTAAFGDAGREQA